MSVTVVNDYSFKPDGDISEGKAAAADLVAYFGSDVPEVRLSLWLESREKPLHHFHITGLDDARTLARLRGGPAIKRFTDRLDPHVDHDTFVSPLCDVWPCGGPGVPMVDSVESQESK